MNDGYPCAFLVVVGVVVGSVVGRVFAVLVDEALYDWSVKK